MGIRENVRQLLDELPPGVRLLAAAKSVPPEQVVEAIEAGVGLIGENYVQEAECVFPYIRGRAELHIIGHLQRNKVRKAVPIADMVETLDSLETARELDLRCRAIGKVMPVLIEVNSAGEKQKSGVLPEDALTLARDIVALANLELQGLMTMGPLTADPEGLRPCFRKTREVFEEIRGLGLANIEMKYLSMGMSGSYRVAIEEGANIVRIGRKIFGER